MQKYFMIVMGVFMMLGLFGCGAKTYKLTLESSFYQTKKTNYKEGENVKVTYNMIATDTDYTFYTDSEDVKLNISYNDREGYVIEFVMPAHEVVLRISSRNSMVMIYQKQLSIRSRIEEAKLWILPDTEENRKTTSWGDPLISSVIPEEEQAVTLDLRSENDCYLIRVIDDENMYYEANDVVLEDGQTLVFRDGEEPMTAVLELYDEDEVLVSTYPMFKAKL